MIDALLASAEVDEPSGAVGALEADRARGIDDRELLDSYSRAVVAVVEHVGPAGVSIAAGSRRLRRSIGTRSSTTSTPSCSSTTSNRSPRETTKRAFQIGLSDDQNGAERGPAR